MSDNLLDLFVGDVVPHVYCKRITIEEHPNQKNGIKVTLFLEMFQDRDALSSLSWLNDLKFSSDSAAPRLLDSFYIKIIALTQAANLEKISKSRVHREDSVADQNVYIIKSINADYDYLWNGTENSKGGSKTKVSLNTPDRTGLTDPVTVIAVSKEAPVERGGGHLPEYIRQEYKNGKWYHVVPFTYTYEYVPKSSNRSLAFAFYSYLDMNHLLGAFKIEGSQRKPVRDPAIRLMNYEGSINTELVMHDGRPALTREDFIDNQGGLWEGPVHYHGTGKNSNKRHFRPGPNGYVGWMAGWSHRPGLNQARLRLQARPNTKLIDYRTKEVSSDPRNDHVPAFGTSQAFTIDPHYKFFEDAIDGVLSPLQKEKKGDFIPKNYNEVSKLYLARDANNFASGLFYIDFRNLLQNRSQLFKIFSPSITGMKKTISGPGFSPAQLSSLIQSQSDAIIKEILNESKMVELRLYRDRVKPFKFKKAYRKFAKYKTYETPSELIGIISDLTTYKTPTVVASRPRPRPGEAKAFFNEIELKETKTFDPDTFTRYFTFHDSTPGLQQTGLYQYRVELDFIDGTYTYLNKFIFELQNIKQGLERYLRFALSGKNAEDGTFKQDLAYGKKGGIDVKKVYFKPYYDPRYGSYNKDFESDLLEEFMNDVSSPQEYLSMPWNTAPVYIIMAYNHFIDNSTISSVMPFLEDIGNLYNMIHPIEGSPNGIKFCIRLLDSIIGQVQDLVGFNKKQSSINTLTSVVTDKEVVKIVRAPEQYDFKNTSAKTLIREQHAFNRADEIFNANINKDYYADYLSAGMPLPINLRSLRAINPEDFIRRARLETLKFFKTPQSAYTDKNIAFTYDPGGFTNMEYSYLAPSRIRIGDPAGAYSYTYNVFLPTAATRLKEQTYQVLAPSFSNFVLADSVFMSCVNQNLNKNSARNIDLSPPPVIIPKSDTHGHKGQPGLQDVLQNTVSYRKFFDDANLTLHDPALHHSFFETNRFQTFTKDIDDSAEYPLKENNFSDHGVYSLYYFREFLRDPIQKIKDIPSGISFLPFLNTLPNSFKAHHYSKQTKFGPNPAWDDKSSSDLRSLYKQSIFGVPKKDYSSFKFFNFNMTAKIEVFRGHGTHMQDDIWSLLTPEDMNFDDDSKKLFCRISYWHSRLLGDLEIPIIDKYFLIYPNATSFPMVSSSTTKRAGGIFDNLKSKTGQPPPRKSARPSSGLEDDSSSRRLTPKRATRDTHDPSTGRPQPGSKSARGIKDGTRRTGGRRTNAGVQSTGRRGDVRDLPPRPSPQGRHPESKPRIADIGEPPRGSQGQGPRGTAPRQDPRPTPRPTTTSAPPPAPPSPTPTVGPSGPTGGTGPTGGGGY